MSKWIPDRKVWAGGVFAVLAALATMALNTWAGADIPAYAIPFIAIGIDKVAGYLLPPSWQDVLKRIDDDVVEMAAASPASSVSREIGEVARQAKARSSVKAFDAVMSQLKPRR